jgi:glycosyltransferase involved in cell wall biosynthesis
MQLLAGEIAPDNYDVVWDAGASMFPMLPAKWDGVPVVADLVDDMVLTFWRAMRSTSGLLAKLRILKYLGVNLLFERYCMRRVAHCCVVSEDDARYFSAVSPGVPVTVVPNGVDIDYFTPGKMETIPGRLVFEGTMAFEPNQQAATYLVRDVMPHIWRHRPDASVALVGRDPPGFIRDLANERVVVTGAVDDIRPYVQQAEVFVCPLLSGAGIKNKLLQAWAMGKAVVATSVSVGGLMASDGSNLLVRDGALSVAEAVLALMDSPEQCRTLGDAGMATVARSFTWQAQTQLFEEILLSVASRNQG